MGDRLLFFPESKKDFDFVLDDWNKECKTVTAKTKFEMIRVFKNQTWGIIILDLIFKFFLRISTEIQ